MTLALVVSFWWRNQIIHTSCITLQIVTMHLIYQCKWKLLWFKKTLRCYWGLQMVIKLASFFFADFCKDDIILSTSCVFFMHVVSNWLMSEICQNFLLLKLKFLLFENYSDNIHENGRVPWSHYVNGWFFLLFVFYLFNFFGGGGEVIS